MIAIDKKENASEHRNQNDKSEQPREYKGSFISKGSKRGFEKNSIIDKEIGTLRSIFTKFRIFFKNILLYIKGFFTLEKINEIKSIFLFKPPGPDLDKEHGNSELKTEDKSNEFKQ